MGAPYITGQGFDKIAGSWSQSGGKQGASVSLDLSDDNPETSWLVIVKAKTRQGEYILGAVRTRSPAAGDPKARTILIAWHPGVIQWSFDFYGTENATARPILSTDECACGGAAFGIVPQNGSRLERRIWAPIPSQPAFAQQGQLSPGPSALTKAYGFLEPAAAASLYVGFVDTLAPLVGGERFIVAPAPVPDTWPRVFSFSFDPDGIPFKTGITWVVSTSPLAVALPGPGDVAVVQGERI